MKISLIAFILIFASSLFASEEETFYFNGQKQELLSYTHVRLGRVETYCAPVGGETCDYEPVQIQTCDNSNPQNCWTTTTTEYRCHPARDVCSTISEEEATVHSVKGLITFVNPNFKTGAIPFSMKNGKYSKELQPENVPAGVVVGVQNEGRYVEYEGKTYVETRVKFFKVSDVLSSKVKQLIKVKIDKTTNMLTLTVKGKLTIKDTVTIGGTGLLNRENVTLEQMRAIVADNGNGTTSISVETWLKKGVFSISIPPEVPSEFKVYGDMKKAWRTFSMRKF